MAAKAELDGFEPKVFGKWSTSGIQIRDFSLAPYLNLDNRKTLHSFGRHASHKFEKGSVNVVERLVNKIMRSGQGKRKFCRSKNHFNNRKSCVFILRENPAEENSIGVFHVILLVVFPF